MNEEADGTRITKTKISVEALTAFNNLRPYLIKLFTHIVVFYLAVNGYQNYLQSNDDYVDFIDRMNQPLITKAEIIDSTIDCASINMTDISGYTFSKIGAGCQCDDKILVKRDCNFITDKYLIPKNSTQAQITKINNAWDKKCSSLYPLTTSKNKRDLQVEDPSISDVTSQTDENTEESTSQVTPSDSGSDPSTSATNDANAVDSTVPASDDNTDSQAINQADSTVDSNTESNQQNDSSIDESLNSQSSINVSDSAASQEISTSNEEEAGTDPTANTTNPNNFLTSVGVVNLEDSKMDQNLKVKLESLKGTADALMTPESLNSEFFDNPNDPAFNFPQANQSNNASSQLTLIPVIKINGLFVPANSQGLPLDQVKNESYPTSCDCFRQINEIPQKQISNFKINQKLCVKKDNSWSTIKYLNSITKFRLCPKVNRCQKYFCKEDSQDCPIVDLWFATNSTTKKTDLVSSLERKKEYKYGVEYMLQVLLPLIDIKISMKNSCTSSAQVQSLNFPLIQSVPCSKAQTSDTLAYESAANILNYNDNFYNTLRLQIPFISNRIESGLFFALESSHAFYRESITCFLQNEKLNTMFKGVVLTNLEDSANKLVLKLSEVLFSFFSIQDYFKFQRDCQLFLLIANSILLGVHVASIIIQIVSMKYCSESKLIWKILKYEVYGTFMVDLMSASVSGYAYFSILKLLSIIKQMTDMKCNDDYSSTKYAAYSAALQGTADKSFEVFLVILFKLALVVSSLIYHSLLFKSKLSEKIIQKIIYESISDGESYNENFDDVIAKKDLKIETETNAIKLDSEPMEIVKSA